MQGHSTKYPATTVQSHERQGKTKVPSQIRGDLGDRTAKCRGAGRGWCPGHQWESRGNRNTVCRSVSDIVPTLCLSFDYGPMVLKDGKVKGLQELSVLSLPLFVSFHLPVMNFQCYLWSKNIHLL